MPEVTVILHTIYQIQTPQGLIGKIVVPIQANQTVEELLARINRSYHPESTLLVVNGKIVTPDYILQEGDELHLIPAISGGARYSKKRKS